MWGSYQRMHRPSDFPLGGVCERAPETSTTPLAELCVVAGLAALQDGTPMRTPLAIVHNL